MKFLFYFLIICSLGFAQDVNYISTQTQFELGESYFMFGDKVQLRAEPNTNAEVLSLLNIGDSIKIVGKTDMTQNCGGKDSNWVQVLVDGQDGFILDCFIAMDKATYLNYDYYVAIEENDDQYFLKTRVVDGTQAYIENKSILYTYTFSIEADGNKGLEGIESILKVNYLSEACGVDGGGFYLFKNQDALHKALSFVSVADGGLYWLVEEFIFPNDEEGIENKIIYRGEKGETIEDETNWIETVKVDRQYIWNGTELQPTFNREELFKK